MGYGWRISLCGIVLAVAGFADRTARAQDERVADAEIMRPTQRGLRLTPVLARSFSRFFVAEEIENLVDLSKEQAAELTESLARRSRQLVGNGGTELRDACEGCLAMLMETDGQFRADTSREFARQMPPILSAMHSFLDGLAEDGRRVLTPEQYAELDRKLRRDYHDLQRMENKMKRWADGGFKEGEPPRLDHFSPEDGPPLEAESENESRGMQRRVRRRAEREVNELGPNAWVRYLARTKGAFEFDDEQCAQADAILAEYRAKAEAIMTPEWRARILENRLRYRAFALLYSDQPAEPFRWRLDKQYQDATEPIERLGQAFRNAILALVTDVQRQAVLAKVQETATRHGLAIERGDAELLGLAP